MYHTQQVKLNVDDKTHALIQFQCEAANRFYNEVFYQIRQDYFNKNQEFFIYAGKDNIPFLARKSKKIKVSYFQFCTEFKNNLNYKTLGGQCAQKTIKSVLEACKSYNALLTLFFKGELKSKPKLPKYRTKRGLAPITFPAQPLKFDLETGDCYLTISRENKSTVHKKDGYCYAQ